LECVKFLSEYASVPYDLQHDKVYHQKTGRLLEHRIGQEFNELGYESWINKGQCNGIDLKVWDSEGNLIIAAEILNWGPTSDLSDKRKRSIRSNLSEYTCNKVLIYTQMGNEQALEGLETENISTLKIGCQIVAKYYYKKLARTQVEGKKIDSRETTLLIKSKIREYLQSLSL
jgi:hypothetical protein